MATVEHILIVGGGIAGLTLPTALHQQGFSPELVERSPEWPSIQRSQSARNMPQSLAFLGGLFPRRPRRGPIEARRCRTGPWRRAWFPRRQRRGPIEATSWGRHCSRLMSVSTAVTPWPN